MIGSSNFSGFYGNDLTPTVNFPTNVSVDQQTDPSVHATSSSTFTGITTDKIPIRITNGAIPSGSGWNGLAYIDVKEENDTSIATTQITTRTNFYTVPQGKRLTITFKTDNIIEDGGSPTMTFTITNTLTNLQIATITLNVYNSFV
jgi:hypothetical protein